MHLLYLVDFRFTSCYNAKSIFAESKDGKENALTEAHQDRRIQVVEAGPGGVVIRVFNIHFRIISNREDKPIVVSRWRPGSEGRPQGTLQIPPWAYAQMIRMAAGVFSRIKASTTPTPKPTPPEDELVLEGGDPTPPPAKIHKPPFIRRSVRRPISSFRTNTLFSF